MMIPRTGQIYHSNAADKGLKANGAKVVFAAEVFGVRHAEDEFGNRLQLVA